MAPAFGDLAQLVFRFLSERDQVAYMSDPDVCATSYTLRNRDGDCWRLRSEGRQKLKRGYFNHRWFYGQEAAVLFQLMARAMAR